MPNAFPGTEMLPACVHMPAMAWRSFAYVCVCVCVGRGSEVAGLAIGCCWPAGKGWQGPAWQGLLAVLRLVVSEA